MLNKKRLTISVAFATLLLGLLLFQLPSSSTSQSLPGARPATPQSRGTRTDADERKPGERSNFPQRPQAVATNCGPSSPSSNIRLTPGKECSDTRFYVDSSAGLDTGCTYRNGGPLVFNINIDRYFGDKTKLIQNGLLGSPGGAGGGLSGRVATLRLPAYDVDFNGGSQGVQPERDKVSLNGHDLRDSLGQTYYLQGDNNIWHLNEIKVPVEYVNFPTAPGGVGVNQIRIDIDTFNPGTEVWCTAIDWATIEVEAPRPALLVHGIFSGPDTWLGIWASNPPMSGSSRLDNLGIPYDTINLGFAPQTIGTNSSAISAKVDVLKQRWNVEKINLIGHSKGGLDSRDYAENSDSIAQVIQIGSPNLGSPLADFIIRGTLRLPPAGAIFVNILGLATSPGGYQLTTEYMAGYNFFHGHNPNVRYTALAGLYDPDCIFCLNFVLEDIVGPGDLIVPRSSVHGLGFTTNATFATVGGNCSFITGMTDPNCDAIHTRETHSNGIFNALQPVVQRFDQASHNAPETELATPQPGKRPLAVSPVPSASKVGSIQQGQTQTQSIVIDQNARAFFTLMYPSGNLDLALISPSGQRFDHVTIQGNPAIDERDEEILGGRIETFAFTTLEPGTWTAEISAPAVIEPSGQVGYAVAGWMETSPITLTGSFQSGHVSLGSPLRLLGTLRNNGTPLLNATVTGLVSLPNNTTQSVTLKDDGANGDSAANDGIYTANFNNTAFPGTYRAVFQADRSAGGGVPAFSRETLSSATVSNSSSTFTGAFASAGVDTNGNALFDKLSVQATLNITQNGTYRLVGRLADTAGNTHDAKTLITLSAGTRTANLDFDGMRLYANRVNGPYSLASISLIEESSNSSDSMLLDTRTDAHQTAALQFRAFEHDPIVFTGNGSAVGVDTNSNGLFDLLRATLEVDIAQAGSYNWTAQLIDRNGRDLGFATGSGTLMVGNNNLVFNFDGSRIGENGVDGPFEVTGLLVYGQNVSLIQQQVLSTPPLRATQFEGRTCPGSISPSSQTFAVSGGTGQVGITISPDCPWTSFVTPVPSGNNSTITNNQSITIRDANTATPYPSMINVSGLTGTISKVAVTLAGLSHTFPADIDLMLVGPNGQSTVLMSDAGGSGVASNLQLTFDQTSSNTLPSGSGLASGTYRPANYSQPDDFPVPGPGSGNYSADLSVFNGLDPNGVWQLLVVDDEAGDTGSITNGWSLSFQSATVPGWITITSGSSGMGSGTTSYTVAANATGSPRSATLTVAGQAFTVAQAGGTAPTVQFDFANFNANEGDGVAHLTVRRTGDATAAAKVNYQSLDDFSFRPCDAAGSAANQRCDYTVTSGQLIFNPGETSKTVDVLLNDDLYVESAETINFSLSNPTGATLGGQSTATVTIQDNETAQPTTKLYVANLNGAKETPPNSSLATGIATLLLNATETSAQISLSYVNLGSPETAALIHGFAPATQTATPLFGLPLGAFSGQTISLTAAQVQQLKAGNLYLNITTTNFSSGEIRGQFLANYIDDPQFFVRAHYADFLARGPDPGGLDYWTSQIAQVCGTNLTCTDSQRITVSAAYFIEQEFQESGAYVYRLYKAAFGEQTSYRPLYAQFMPDRARVVGGASLNQGKLDFAQLFVSRAEFSNRYSAGLSATQFVDAILTTVQQGAGVTYNSTQRNAFVTDVNTGGRGLMLKNLAEDPAFKAAVFNRAFVLTQYFGYLRRDPDQGGYDFWLGVLNSQPNNFRGMVCSFLTSTEYQQRFAPIAFRSNAGC